MRVGTEENLAGPRVAFLGQSSMANSRVMRPILALEHAFGRIENPMAVRIIDDIVKVGNVLFPYKIAQDIDVAIGF